MKPKIEPGNLPEQVIFTLKNGDKVAVVHMGNRIELNIMNGQPLVIHPLSGNAASVMVGDSSALSLPFNPDDEL